MNDFSTTTQIRYLQFYVDWTRRDLEKVSWNRPICRDIDFDQTACLWNQIAKIV